MADNDYMNTLEVLTGIKTWVKKEIGTNIYDISANHDGAKYADLSAALGNNGANVPINVRKGGMSVKFLNTSDNYVVFTYLLQYANTTAGNTAFLNTANWQGVDDEPTAGSNNLVKSGGCKLGIDKYKVLDEGSLIDTVVGTNGNYTDYNLSNLLSAGIYIIECDLVRETTLTFKTANGTIVAQNGINDVGKNALSIFIPETVQKIRFAGNGSTFSIYSESGVLDNILEYEKRNYPISVGDTPVYNIVISNNAWTDYNCNLSAGIYLIDVRVPQISGSTDVSVRFKDSDGNFIKTSPASMVVNINSRKLIMFFLPTDAAKIRLMGTGSEYSIYQTDGFLDSIIPDFDTKIKQMTNTLEGLSDVIEDTDTLLASITSTSTAYTDYDCELSAGIYKVVETVSTEVATVSFKNAKGEIITRFFPTTDKYVYLPQDAAYIRFAYNGTKVDIYESKGILPAVATNNSATNTQTIVKTVGNGTGYDYQDIPSALTAITDASESKIYELRVCSDYKYTLPTQLFKSDNATHPDSDTAPDYCAALFTKSYINIVGWNRRRKIEVIMPDTVTKPDNIVAMHLQGNCTIKNIDFTIKNGRYAIHQESGGSASSIDYHATTILEDSVVTHLGNYNTALQYWNSTFAQANGACHGLTCIYKNVTWVNGYYMHSNANFDAPVTAKFINCKKTLPLNTANIDSGEINVCYVGNNGQGHRVRLHVEGSSLISIYGRMGMMTGNTLDNPARDIRTQIPMLTGAGNAPMVLHSQVIETLSFETLVNNKNVSVVGGTAKSLIYGDDYKVYVGAADAVGVCIGTEAIQYRNGNNNYTLAYRLGDCASENKTLIVDVDGTEETITFAENFKTNFSTWDDATIIAYINNQLTYCKAVLNSPYSKFSLPFDDCAEEGYNGGSNTILYGMPLKRDKGTNWIVCESGETPDGIALERMNAGEFGLIGYFNKSLYRDLYGLQTTAQNTKVSVGSNGEWVEDNSNPIMIAVYNNAFKSI